MSDDVTYGPRSHYNARLLVQTAKALGYPAKVVRATANGYRVPQDVLEAALGLARIHEGVEYAAPTSEPDPSTWRSAAPDKPRGNASRDAFAEYAQAIGLDVDEGMSRNDIRDLVNGKE